jgi:predicted AlkP superfamily pyrophosphatase or phosphodiesterase
MFRRFPKTAAIAAGAVAVAGVATVGVLASSGSASGAAAPQSAQLSTSHYTHQWGTPTQGRHTLLISVDGLHASDLQKYIAMFPHSNLAKLANRGTRYPEAQGSFPTDSFPGMLALATGGTPKQTGVYYDASYSRAMYDPSNTTCTGPAGNSVTYDESINQSTAHLSGTTSGTGGANASAIDPANLPRAIVNGVCQPVYPRNFLESNTIFEVAHNAGLYTAWSDKHPAYELLNGNDKFNTAGGSSISDLFTPEINSTINPNQLKIPIGPNAGQYVPVNGGDYTTSVDAVMAYDNLKVGAILNQINGMTSTGGTPAGGKKVPSIFGMNFQAVSVGQKLPVGGYYDNGQTFSPQLLLALQFVDSSVGQFTAALKAQGLTGSTEIVLSAKHGQSPRNRAALHRIAESGSPTSLTGFVDANATTPHSGEVADDVALLWWQNSNNQGNAVNALNLDKITTNILSVDHVYSGAERNSLFGVPAATPNYNDLGNRIPDVVIQPQHGVIYSTSIKKVAEHGGGTQDDRNVALLVVNGWGGHEAKTIKADVSTTQVAPTILKWLGLDPWALTAAVQAGTTVLPGLGHHEGYSHHR